jgi:hypothetical protein
VRRQQHQRNEKQKKNTFFRSQPDEVRQSSVAMAKGRGKVNYKVDPLIEVVEEKLIQGSLGWQEVAALYQVRTQEQVLRDHEDVK